MTLHLAIITDLRKKIEDLNKTITARDQRINQLLNERFLMLKSAPKESQKAYIDCGATQKFEIRRNICNSIDKINELNVHLRKYKLKIQTIHLVHEDLFEQVSFLIKTEREQETERPTIDNFVYVKDRFNISDFVWTVLRCYLMLPIPSNYALRKRKTILNTFTPIFQRLNGYYCDPVLRINQRLTHIFNTNRECFQSKRIIIKLQLDGFVIHKLNNLLNFSISIINEGKKSTSAFGTYLIGLFHINKESYEDLKPIVTEIWDRFQTMKFFEFEGDRYPMEFKCCSDHKMQALVISYQHLIFLLSVLLE